MKQALTVVQVVPRLDSGGVERGTLEVAKALVERGHRAVVVSAGGRMVGELEAQGAEHVKMGVASKTPKTLLSVRALRSFLRREKVDVLHARSRVPAWVSYLAWKKMKAGARPRYVTTVHGLHSVSRYSAVMTTGEVVVAVSDAAVRYVFENYPKTPREKVRVIHRGVDPEEFPHEFAPSEEWASAWLKEFPELRGKRLVTIVGRLTRLKGHHEFLSLISRLDEDAHGLIVGGEDPRRVRYAREIRERVARENLEGRVTFTGHRGDIREIAAASDVVVSLSSKPESFGRSVLEALRLGTPVLGWDHGGVGEVLAGVYPEGRVTLGDEDELARRASALLSEPKRPVPVSEKFTKREMLEKTLSLYEELASSA